MRFWFLFTYLFSCSSILLSQNSFFKHYQPTNGLPFENVYASIQDSKGYMWFCSDRGVARFDGEDWLHLNSSDGLPDNDIHNLFEDSKGRIWFSTFNGELCYYYQGEIYNGFINDKIENGIKDYYEDKDGTLWIIPLNNDFSSINKFNFKFYQNELYKQRKGFLLEQYDSLYMITKDQTFVLDDKFFKFNYSLSTASNIVAYYHTDNEYYYVSSIGLIRISEQGEELIIPQEYLPTTNDILSIYITKSGAIWLSNAKGGVYIYENYPQQKYNYKTILDQHKISSVFEDTEGNKWFTTLSSGVFFMPYYFSESNINMIDNFDNTHNFSCIDYRQNEFWLASKEGIIYNYTNKSVHKIDLNKYNDKDQKSISNIVEFAHYEQSLLVVTTNGVYVVDKENYENTYLIPMPLNKLYSPKKIIQSKIGLTVSHSMGILLLKEQKGKYYFEELDIPYERIHTHTVVNDEIWYVTANHLKIYKYNNKTLKTINLKHFGISQRVKQLITVNDSIKLCSTNGQGLFIINKESTLSQLREHDGLSSNFNSKVKKHDNYFWVSSMKGLDMIAWENNEFIIKKSFNSYNGLGNNTITDFTIADDTIIFCNKNILSQFVIDERKLQNQKVPPPIYIDEIRVNNSIINKSELVVEQDDNIQITAKLIDYNQDLNTKIQYRLLGESSSDWQNTNSRSIKLVSIQPGDYRFEIRSKKEESEWSIASTISIHVKPSLWQHPIFLLILFSILILVIASLISKYHKTSNKKHLDEINTNFKIKTLEQKALQAMMNPHFIFNVLNSIQYLLSLKDADKAQTELNRFAKLIRLNLEITQDKFITIENEIEYLELYLSLEKLRFDDSFSYEIKCSDALSIYDTNIPTMLIQPFVENAIWHGIMPQNGKGFIRIDFFCDDNNLLIKIFDNGIGYNPELNLNKTHKSVGLKMTKERLELMQDIYKRTFEFKIDNIQSTTNDKSGTLVTITLPNNL